MPGTSWRRADVHVGEEGEHRRHGSLVDEERPAVGERLDGHLLLERGQVLGRGRPGAPEEQAAGEGDARCGGSIPPPIA